MMQAYIRIPLLALALLLAGALVAPPQAEANVLGFAQNLLNGATHTIHKGVKKIKKKVDSGLHAVKRGGNRILHKTGGGARRVGRWAGGVASDWLKIARGGIGRASGWVQNITNEGWSYLIQAARHPKGNCEQLQRRARGQIVRMLSPAIDGTIGQLPRNLFTAAKAGAMCRSNMRIGFNCGVFPYANKISSSLKQGGKAAKKLAYAVGRAALHECRNWPLPLKGDCAISVTMARNSGRGFRCIQDIARKFGNRRGGRGGGGLNITKKNLQKFCTEAGETAFGVALDALIANEEGAAASAAQFLINWRDGMQKAKKVEQMLPRSCRLL